LHDRHSALLDRDYDSRADFSVSLYDIASTFRGSVTLDGWPERDVVVQFIVRQVDRFLDETAVRHRHLNIVFCTFTPFVGMEFGSMEHLARVIIIVTDSSTLKKN